MIGPRQLPVAPLLPVAVGFAAGIAAGALSDMNLIWWLTGAVALLSAIFAFCGRHWLMALALSVLPGLLAGHNARPQMLDLQALNDARPQYAGIVDEESRSPSTQRLMVTVDSVGGREVSPFRVMVTVSDPSEVVVAGDRVRFSALLMPPGSDGTHTDSEVSRRWLFGQRVSAVAAMAGNARITVAGYTDSPAVVMARWRRHIGDALTYSGLQPETAAFLYAVLMGEREYVDTPTRKAFARTGVAHVLALSGTHLAVIAMMVSVLFIPLRLMGRRRWEWMATLATLWAYALLTGLSPSVTRAVIMVSFVLVGRAMRWQTSAVNSLCAAVLLILLCRPFDLFSIGFQLSVAAVASLLLFTEMLTIQTRRGWLRTASKMAAVPVAAVAGTAPLAAWYFHAFPVVFLLTNIPAALLLPPMMAGGVAVLCLESAGIPCGAFVWITDTLYNIMARVVGAVASLPGVSVEIGDFQAVWIVVIYAGMVVLWLGWQCRRKWPAVAGAAMIAVAAGAMALSGNRHDCDGCFPLGSEAAVAVVKCQGDSAIVFTDAAAPGLRRQISRETWRELDRRRLADRYAGRVRFAAAALDSGTVSAGGNSWLVDGKRYVIAGRDSLSDCGTDCDYLVITRGFRGDAVDVAARCRPDTVIVSPTLTGKKALDCVRSLRAAGYQVKLRH